MQSKIKNQKDGYTLENDDSLATKYKQSEEEQQGQTSLDGVIP